jgi:hypothetical protein
VIAGQQWASATKSSGERPVFIAIAPCRLIDTRPGADNVGPRSTPINAGETFNVVGRGGSGNCSAATIPNDALALTLNVTAVGATAQTNLRIFPSDAPVPTASNLNPAPGAAPTPNAVTTDLSVSGQFSVYNAKGRVNVVIDAVGYFVDHNHDDRYFTKTELEGMSYSKAQIDANFYTKTQTNATFYNKTQIDSGFYGKPYIDSNYYTKTQANELFFLQGDLSLSQGTTDIKAGTATVSTELGSLYGTRIDTGTAVLPLTGPTAIAGAMYRLKTVTYCAAGFSGGTITAVTIGATPGGSVGTDSTDRTTNGCYLLNATGAAQTAYNMVSRPFGKPRNRPRTWYPIPRLHPERRFPCPSLKSAGRTTHSRPASSPYRWARKYSPATASATRAPAPTNLTT